MWVSIMLSLKDYLTDDKEANKIIERFVSDRILEVIQFELDMFDFGHLEELNKIKTDDESLFYGITDDISPENVGKEEANEAFLSLVTLLLSDQALEAGMLQNYKMYKLIGRYCEIAEDIGLELSKEFPEYEKECVLKALEKMEEAAECTADDLLENFENMENYKDICFEDWDFLELDMMTFDDLKASRANEVLGMIGEGETLLLRPQRLKFPDGIEGKEK